MSTSRRFRHHTYLLIGYFSGFALLIFLTGFSRTTVKTSSLSAVSTSPSVSWAYLRAVARTEGNASLVTLLKQYKQLAPMHAVAADCESRNPFDEGCTNGLLNQTDSSLRAVRLDFPLRINRQLVTVSCVAIYHVTGKVLASGATMYGPAAPQKINNYAAPVAAFSEDTIQFIGNLSFRYDSTAERIVSAAQEARIATMNGRNTSVTYRRNIKQPVRFLQADVAYITFSLNPSTGYGEASLQVNGISGPTHKYDIKPQL